MRLADLSGVKSWLHLHHTRSDPFWQHQAYAVSEIQIQLYYARSNSQGLRREAIDAIDALQAAVITAAFRGELQNPPKAIVMHELPQEPFLVDQLVDGLVKLTPARRRACLFALDSNQRPEDAADLMWKNVKGFTQLSDCSAQIIREQSRTRHMKVPYVFWEWATPQIAAPILDFKWSIERAFDCTWPELTLQFRRMIRVHRGADAAHLQGLVTRLSMN